MDREANLKTKEEKRVFLEWYTAEFAKKLEKAVKKSPRHAAIAAFEALEYFEEEFKEMTWGH